MKTVKRIALFCLSLLSVFSSPVVNGQQNGAVDDKDIRVVDFEDMKYPPVARASRIQGVVVIRVKLDGGGRVAETSAVSGMELLVRDSLLNAKKWRFKPNSEKGAVIVYVFRLPGGECKSEVSLAMFRPPNIMTVIGCDVPVQTSH